MYQSPEVVMKLMLALSSALYYHQIVARADQGQPSWTPSEDSWNYWWSYSGPTYWGLLNLDWFMCDKGRRQSPIDIETSSLIYDPHLKPLRADKNLISGILYNDGHAIVFNGSPSHLQAQQQRATEGQSNKQLQVGLLDNQQATASLSRQNRSSNIQKRHANPINGVLSLMNQGSSLNSVGSQLDSTASILRDLSNSVELSISQNDRLESADKVIADGGSGGGGGGGDGGDNLGDSIGQPGEAGDVDTTTPQVNQGAVQFTGAGLDYTYKFETLYLRFGSGDSKSSGSEHLINSHSYAAELQLFAYNSVLYKNFAEASSKPHGLLAIAILIDPLPVSSPSLPPKVEEKRATATLNEPLESLLAKLAKVRHRGAWTAIAAFNLSALLPDPDYFVAYEGSLTTPACHESAYWLVLNKPLYISQSSLDGLRSVSADEQSSASTTGTLIAGNIRPVQPVNNRPIRTNIKPNGGTSVEKPETCQRLWTKYQYKRQASKE